MSLETIIMRGFVMRGMRVESWNMNLVLTDEEGRSLVFWAEGVP